MSVKKGKLIVIEGVDGAGKTTQIQRLADNLSAEGCEVFVTSEPTCKAANHEPTVVGSIIADVLLGKIEMSASSMAALFLADRVLHNTDRGFGIKAMIDRGIYVICDRYYYSSCAYQGLDSDLDWVIEQNINCPDIMRPDVCVFLDLDPETASLRRQTRGEEIEIFERPEVKTSTVREKFIKVFERMPNENVRRVDASGTIDGVAERVLCAVRSVLD